MKVTDANEKFPQIRVTKLAARHAEMIVMAMQESGLSISRTGYLSELILSQPIPTQPTHSVEVKRTRKAKTSAALAAL